MRRFLASAAALALALPAPQPAAAQDYACAVPAHIATEALPERNPQLVLLHEFATGAGVRVAVIDTGVAPTAELDQVFYSRDFVDIWAPAPHLDCDSHGTVVAGIIGGTSRGIAPDAEIIAIRQTSAHYRTFVGEDEVPGAGSLQTLADAIHSALDEHASVINISVVSCLAPDVAGRVDTSGIEHALARAEYKGTVVVAAAGNAGSSCHQGDTVIPAHFPTVIAVGARADAYTMAEYSIDAPGTPISAPGTVEIALASDGGGWADGTWTREGAVSPYTGTSFATPVVSGAIALLRERHPGLTPADIRELVAASAEPNGGALDPLTLLTMLPPEPVDAREPVIIEPTEHTVHYSSRRGWRMLEALFIAAVAVLCRPRMRPDAQHC